MISPRRSRALVAIASTFAVAAAASGCEIIANFDRSLIDAGPPSEDAAAFDAQYPQGDGAQPPVDAGGSDASDAGGNVDATVNDSGNDSSVNDAGTTDTGSKDSATADSSDGASAADSNVPDTSTQDSAAEDAASDDGG